MKKCIWLMILSAVIFASGSILEVQAKVIPPHGQGQIGLQSVVLCESLTVREEPNTGSKEVVTVPYGYKIIVMEQKDGWAYCTLSDSIDEDRFGWVNADYIAVDPAWYLTDGTTTVYAWNDTTAPKVALLDKDTELPILKEEEGGWLIVSLRGATGWIHKNAAN